MWAMMALVAEADIQVPILIVRPLSGEDAVETGRSAEAPHLIPDFTEQTSPEGAAKWVAAGRAVRRTGVAAPAAEHRLPRVTHADVSGIWMVGVHGGAGESSLAHVLGAREAGRAWPLPQHFSQRSSVVLVARTNARGIDAMRNALREVASGSVSSVHVVGVTFVRDAPKLPAELRNEARIVASAAATSWWVPWIDDWRRTTTPTLKGLPRVTTQVLTDLRTHLHERTPS